MRVLALSLLAVFAFAAPALTAGKTYISTLQRRLRVWGYT